MKFLAALNAFPFMLYDGPMETRIKYGTSLKLDKEASIFTLLTQEDGREALKKLYEQDILTTEHYDVPIILNTPTFRASLAHCERLGLSIESIKRINQEAILFVKGLRKQFKNYKDRIFISGLIGPKKAGYSPELSFTIDEAIAYHSQQAQALGEAGDVDIISIAAMPGIIEAIGCARAVSQIGLPYSVGVILNSDGTLLDGHHLEELITHIDNNIFPAPNFYILSCTHPNTVSQALRDHHPIYSRILGIKANGSNLPGRDLVESSKPVSDDPDIFAEELIKLGKEFHFKIYGCCCGTDNTHIEALVRKLKEGVSSGLLSR